MISGPPTTALGDGPNVGLVPRLGDPCVTCIAVVACRPPGRLALMDGPGNSEDALKPQGNTERDRLGAGSVRVRSHAGCWDLQTQTRVGAAAMESLWQMRNIFHDVAFLYSMEKALRLSHPDTPW